SAWLIRTFIDPKAKFAFAPEAKKPPKAVPFDMYEGGFGHRGEDCTFETLIKVFHIRNKKVQIMAEVVHDADLFDEKFGRKEGFGIDEAMGRSGHKTGDVNRLGFPRTDLHVSVAGVEIKPGLALGSWAAFAGNDKAAMVMGDLVLLENELTSVMKKLRGAGFEITAV